MHDFPVCGFKDTVVKEPRRQMSIALTSEKNINCHGTIRKNAVDLLVQEQNHVVLLLLFFFLQTFHVRGLTTCKTQKNLNKPTKRRFMIRDS